MQFAHFTPDEHDALLRGQAASAHKAHLVEAYWKRLRAAIARDPARASRLLSEARQHDEGAAFWLAVLEKDTIRDLDVMCVSGAHAG
ncbi:MAG: hypothetical protein JST54_12590 [Deltaproteobacteria bacterium]|nr:hypothetical protein [Deltaproteobacteria bacterium]